MLLRDVKQCCDCVWNNFFVAEIEQKQAILCLKHKHLNINFLFIELLHKISITFVIMLIFRCKNWRSSCDIKGIVHFEIKI